ncbi:MAG: MBL fold metallo-hydrolase [Clostridiales bacterium]|nr:MBL fold metallo-hydrolase [Clostridiales bacterium]
MIEQVLDNVYRIEVPLPDNPLKVLNSYIIKSTKGRNLLIDTGFNRIECEQTIQGALAELEIDMSMTDMFITHLHSDHCGLIAVLPHEDTKLYSGEIDGELINFETGNLYWAMLDELFIKYGFPRAEFGRNTDIHPGRKFCNEKRVDFIYLEEGDVLEVGDYKLELVFTPGHTPGHMCLYDRGKKVLFSGDHILGDITPNICIELSCENPLKYYFDSLAKVEGLQVNTILTAHRKPVPDMYERIRELYDHHERRIAEVWKILEDQWKTGYEVARDMTWRIRCKNWSDFPAPQKWFAAGEAVAHLQFMHSRGDVLREERDGVYYYRRKEL